MRIPFTNFHVYWHGKAAPPGLQSVDRGGWFPIVVREPFTGAWQRNQEIRNETVLANYAVFSCLTIIPSDIAKCRPCLKERDSNGVWTEVDVAAFSPVLNKPNHYQTIIQFVENWVLSKLLTGNTYVLLERDNRTVVTAMYVLDPLRCKPLVAPNGEVWYSIGKDNLSGVEEELQVPARDIIHDRWPVTLHPLVGMPPLMACRLAASTSQNIQAQSDAFFANSSQAGGILSAEGNIDQAQADRIKKQWEDNYKGGGYGRVAVMGNGMKYESIVATAVNSQLVEQLGSAGKIVTTAFNIPAYMVGVGDPPAYNNVEALNQQYYSQCLQKLFESIEELLDIALGLRPLRYGVEFDLDNLLRMDTATRIKAMADGVRGGVLAINEARAKLGYGPKKGGDTPFLQHQDYPIDMLADRTRPAPGAAAAPSADSGSKKPVSENDNDNSQEALSATRALTSWIAREMLADASA